MATAAYTARFFEGLDLAGQDGGLPGDATETSVERTTPPLKARRTRPTRAEKSEASRRAIFLAAARVVGEFGYADASISRITELASVAHGTFYNYFDSRQDLFEQLLPELGRLLLEHVTSEVSTAADPVEREDKRLSAWFSFLSRHPEFYRILNEAEVFVPDVFQAHVARLGDGYVRALRRAKMAGQLGHFDDDELEPIAYILLAARSYLTLRYSDGDDRGRVPHTVTSAYRKLLAHGLFGMPLPEDDPDPPSPKTTRTGRRKAPRT